MTVDPMAVRPAGNEEPLRKGDRENRAVVASDIEYRSGKNEGLTGLKGFEPLAYGLRVRRSAD